MIVLFLFQHRVVEMVIKIKMKLAWIVVEQHVPQNVVLPVLVQTTATASMETVTQHQKHVKVGKISLSICDCYHCLLKNKQNILWWQHQRVEHFCGKRPFENSAVSDGKTGDFPLSLSIKSWTSFSYGTLAVPLVFAYIVCAKWQSYFFFSTQLWRWKQKSRWDWCGLWWCNMFSKMWSCQCLFKQRRLRQWKLSFNIKNMRK